MYGQPIVSFLRLCAPSGSTSRNTKQICRSLWSLSRTGTTWTYTAQRKPSSFEDLSLPMEVVVYLPKSFEESREILCVGVRWLGLPAFGDILEPTTVLQMDLLPIQEVARPQSYCFPALTKAVSGFFSKKGGVIRYCKLSVVFILH